MPPVAGELRRESDSFNRHGLFAARVAHPDFTSPWPTDVTIDRPSGAMARPTSSVGPNVICSGLPSGNRCRHRCETPLTKTLKYIQVPSGDHAAAMQAPGGPTCVPGERPSNGVSRHR